MINLQTDGFSIVLGGGTRKEQLLRDRLFAGMVIDKYPLSDDDAITAYVTLDPREARVDGPLEKQLSRADRTIESGQRLVLIRWSDDSESLVSFPAADASPSTELLTSAYHNGYATKRVRRLLATRKGVRRGQA